MTVRATGRRVEPLSRHHDRTGFSCGVEALDRYLQQQARQDAERYIAAPFVLVDASGSKVLGYYTLSSSVIELDELPQALIKRLPRYPRLPVTLIGRLAVDAAAKGHGAGSFLLMDALHRCFTHAGGVAAMAVVVDAKDEAAAEFYRRFDFEPLQHSPQRLFLPMRKVAEAFDFRLAP